ncbi:uncharacterized protein LOC123563802 isoform X2 [Mercenaria mercenaria]|uniref:uncharacterized protein LOC123563802 isoform X2 n=1 Tax=Mercenaria mercenaria TaxID=6596 RepID=UPI00234E6BDA|nr:uncharacterized protein LOC123563802 isoform X2 [Mercenaria mercenaria]
MFLQVSKSFSGTMANYKTKSVINEMKADEIFQLHLQCESDQDTKSEDNEVALSNNQTTTALAVGLQSLMLHGGKNAKYIYGGQLAETDDDRKAMASQTEQNTFTKTDGIKFESVKDSSEDQSPQSYDSSAYPTGSHSMLIPGEEKNEYVCDQLIEQSLPEKKKSVYGNNKRGGQHAPTDESNTFISTDGTSLESVKDSDGEQLEHTHNQKKTALAIGSHSLMLRGERKAKYMYGEQSAQSYHPSAYPTGSRSMLIPGEKKNEYVCDQFIEQQTRSKTQIVNSNQTGTCNLMAKEALQAECSYKQDRALDEDGISKQVDSQEADELFPAVRNLQLSPADLDLIEKVCANDGLHGSTSSHTTRW